MNGHWGIRSIPRRRDRPETERSGDFGMASANPKATAAKPETGGPPRVDLDSLLTLARQKSVDGRREVFSTIKDLFFDGEGTLNERERALMGEILRRLIHEVELSLRKDIAERLASNKDAPRALVAGLANDDIEVAYPILLNSDVLHDADLIEIIRHRTQAHQLAVAMRKSVSEDVSQALVDTGDASVITTFLENHDASISRATMEYLVAESKRVDSFQNPLVRRRDLPPDLARKMYWWVSAALRRHIVDTFDVDPTVVDDSIEGVVADRLADESAESAGSSPGDLAEAFAVAKRMAERDLLSAAFLLECLREGEVSLFEAGFAEVTGLTPRSPGREAPARD